MRAGAFLDAAQMAMVEKEAMRRRRYNQRHGFSDNRTMAAVGDDDVRWHRELHGTAAEYVVALYLGLPWSGRGGDPRDRRADVGENIEVKWSERRGLILKAIRGHPTGPHVLVTGTNPYLIVGWYHVRQRDYFERVPDTTLPVPAVVIPAEELSPIDTLLEPGPTLALPPPGPEPYTRRCVVELPQTAPRWQPHPLVRREDGSIRCVVCHPVKADAS